MNEAGFVCEQTGLSSEMGDETVSSELLGNELINYRPLARVASLHADTILDKLRAGNPATNHGFFIYIVSCAIV